VDELGKGFIRPGRVLMLGDTQENSELILLAEFTLTTQQWVVRRGVYDTTPKVWPVGTRVWAFPDSEVVVDTTVRAAGDEFSYWLQPRTRAVDWLES